MSTPVRPEHAGWFDDVRRIINVIEVTPGLPLPSICNTLASFNYTGITHAEEAAAAVVTAETILSYALNVEFTPKDTPRVGSSEHYILAGFMASGLEVDIVARAQHVTGHAAPELAGRAA